MARKPNKKPPHRKPPSVNQRLRAEARRNAAPGKSASDQASWQNKPDVRVNKAQDAWNRGDYENAIWYYERALARDQNNPVLLVDVARAYALRFRYADAEKLVNLAESLYPDNAHLQQMLGRSHAMLQRFDRAIACYGRFLDLAPTSPDRSAVLLEMAKMHERLHDLTAAKKFAEEALALTPNYDKAQYMLANIDRRAGDVAGAKSCWRQIIESPKASLGVIADSWYQLASLHDKAGEYGAAFEALIRAKKIFSRAAAHHSDDAWTIGRAAGKSFANINFKLLERWSMAGRELDPLPGGLALLTSHPRSGTTLLEQVLDSHPGAISADELQIMPEMVYVPIGRKANSADPVPQVLDRTPLDDLNLARQVYWSSMEGALREPIAGRLLIDKNPELTMLLPLVARVFPEMKIVFALRDPRDVVLSCFMQQLPLNPVSVHYLTLEGAANKYATTMRAWLKIRGMLQNPWIEIRYEDMVSDLEGQARKVLGFLGLEWDERVLDYHRRAQSKHVHSPTYEAVTKPIYTSSVARWRNYAEQLEPYINILRPFIDEFGYA